MEELERKTEEKMIQKKELRKKIKEKLSFTTEKYRKEADRKITESVLELNEYKSADCVFCYVSTEKEMDTFSILQDILRSGKHLGVPKCTGKGIMNVYEIHSLQELYPGAYGILEPKEDPERLIQPEAIDFAFICNAFFTAFAIASLILLLFNSFSLPKPTTKTFLAAFLP